MTKVAGRAQEKGRRLEADERREGRRATGGEDGRLRGGAKSVCAPVGCAGFMPLVLAIVRMSFLHKKKL